MKTYTVERRIFKIKTGWFKSELKPLWCLVETGEHIDYSDHWCDTRSYSCVILKSEDKAYVDQEFLNFRGDQL